MVLKFHFFALAAHGKGLSGGDRIFIEFTRRWSRKHSVYVYVWKEGYEMCKRQRLKVSSIKYQVSSMGFWRQFGFLINYVARIFEGVRLGLTLKLRNSNKTYIYSASEFWMDTFPCVILKLRFPKVRWIAGWYQTAPNPIAGFSGGRYRFSAFLYWFVQLPIRPLIKKFADKVIVNNEIERKQFPKMDKEGKVIVLIGAVDLERVEEWKSRRVEVKKVYDAVFQGRFHPQKGVVEFIDIWKKVVDKKPNAKLAMIGDGPLMKSVKLKIKSKKLEKNVKLFGYVFDGPKKYKIFSQSKLVVHPAFYDSGGMASAEAMAFGLPCVGFDLPAYKSYYPKGMAKVPMGNLEEFAENILELLDKKEYREKLGGEAERMIKSSWSWDARAEEIIRKIS